MFTSLFQIGSNQFLSNLLLWAIGLTMICLLGPVKLFQESDVPITLQSLLVVLLPVLLGWKIGFGIVIGYLLLGALGVPVFVGYSHGIDKFSGATGGFLIAFALAAVVSGLVAEMKSIGPRIRALIALILGHLVILVLGLMWLWNIIPEEDKWLRIQNYFAPATFVKIALSYIIIQILIRFDQRKKNVKGS